MSENHSTNSNSSDTEVTEVNNTEVTEIKNHENGEHGESNNSNNSNNSNKEKEKAPEFKEFSDLEKILHFYFVKKAPALPDGIKKFIVSASPWIAVVLLIFTIPAVLILLGLSALIPFALVGSVGSGLGYFASTIGSIVSLVLYALAIPGLFKKSRQGWNFVYYSELVSFVVSILSLNIFGALLGFVIGMYFLFQVQSYYKNDK